MQSKFWKKQEQKIFASAVATQSISQLLFLILRTLQENPTSTFLFQQRRIILRQLANFGHLHFIGSRNSWGYYRNHHCHVRRSSRTIPLFAMFPIYIHHFASCEGLYGNCKNKYFIFIEKYRQFFTPSSFPLATKPHVSHF